MEQSNNEFRPNVLDALNPQKFTSQIPVPSQDRRRNTTNMGLTDIINKSIERNSIASSKKRHRSTVAGEEPSMNSRLSQRYSSLPHTNNINTSFLTNAGSNMTRNGPSNRDPRPLRDKNFQNAIQQEIFDYLSQNKFDIEMSHPISLKFLKLPTQKGFTLIFKWLYLRLDPGYGFTKSIEHEVYQILKNLQYPYLESINKSQISAVGGSSWPRFLGMLHWLVQLNLKLDASLNELDHNIMNENTQEMTILNHPLTTLDEQDQKQEKYELMVEKLFIDYVMESYKSFLRLEDNYEPYMKELEAGFMKFIHIIGTDIDRMGTRNDEILLKCQEMAKRSKDLAMATQKCKALKNDLAKFQNYVNSVQHKSHEWPKKLERMKLESEHKRQEISNLEDEVKTLQKSLKTRGVSIEVIDEKSNRREQIVQDLEVINKHLDKLAAALKSDKLGRDNVVKNMMDAIRQYNSAIDNLFDLRAKLGDNLDLSYFKVSISEDGLLDKTDAIAYEDLMPSKQSIKNNIRQALLNLYENIQVNIEKCQKENASIEAELATLQSEIHEKTNLIEQRELLLSDAKSIYELKMQESESDLLSQKIEIERLEKKISDFNRLAQEKISDAEQLVQATKLKHEELLLDLNRRKALLHAQIIEIIEYASNFKINIQTALEKTENRITQELELL
ncbi:hypothetical protein HG536_0H02280 [Torulaspora globosa]|uniref:Kinetochore protein NDC80 n=1 Tax=Torulaspora globosa TaxID=48254 RepID=A0A7G3ZMW7_9SACH|nr:uncharacterized protein HG536_0H02280 [Torulaspora globosa]QLL34853.1 hypothetical protein HG536_0H02280 [Torulaspora globosa]